MHPSSPSAITYPSSPQPYYLPHSPTTYPCPTPPSSTTHLTTLPPGHDLHHPALLPASLPYDLHTTYPTQPYYRPHYPTTCTRPTPPSSTTHLTTLLLHSRSALLHPALPPAHDLPHYSAIYPRSDYPTYVHTAPISPPALSPATQYYPAHCTHCTHCTHRTHVPHATPPCPSPPQMYHATYIL